MINLRVCDAGNAHPLEASKWLSTPVLLDVEEMHALLEALGSVHIFLTGMVLPRESGSVSKHEFLERYEDYISALKRGELPSEKNYRAWFSSVFTMTQESLYEVIIEQNRHIIKVDHPVIQLQSHLMDYSRIDGKFRSMVFGSDSILWGIQFSYPQLYRNPVSQQVEKVDDSPSFPNTKLFRSLQNWIRENTIPTPFIADDKLTNVPVRLGKKCLVWINQHPQLRAKSLKVSTPI